MSERISTVLLSVPRGLHVLRYVGAKDMKRPPRVVIAGRPGFSEGTEFLFAPDVVDRTLSRVGDCVAILAPTASTLLVTSIGQPQSISPDVELKLDPLDREPAGAKTPAAAPAAVERPAPSGHFVAGGHLQRRGECAADEAGWLGAPDGVDAIESFAISWTEPVKGLRLGYGCEMPSRGRHMARVPGQIVGARGQATPITRVFFELSGSAAAEHELVVSAAFRGCPVQVANGGKLELAGPTGQEPLTGLKIDLRVRQSTARPVEATPPVLPAAELPVPAAANERGRVRVFRAPGLAAAR